MKNLTVMLKTVEEHKLKIDRKKCVMKNVQNKKLKQ